MQVKGIFANRSALFQFGILFYLLIMGLILGSASGAVILRLSQFISESAPDHTTLIHFYTTHTIQFVSVIFLFALPAIGTAYLCSRKPAGFLHLQTSPDAKTLLLSALMICLIYPAVDITTHLNMQMHLPDFMASLENWMREAENDTAEMTENLLSEKGIAPFITNLFIISIMAAITEELLFRGALLSIVRKKIKNPHIAIWLVAIIFSAIHFQFFGFIPRMLLGAVLGYLLYWSGNLWVPIFAHFLNNALSIIGYKTGLFEKSNSATLITADAGISEWIITISIATGGVALFVLCAKAMKNRKSERLFT